MTPARIMRSRSRRNEREVLERDIEGLVSECFSSGVIGLAECRIGFGYPGLSLTPPAMKTFRFYYSQIRAVFLERMFPRAGA